MSGSPQSSSSGGGVSDTSTLVYDQEPFESYVTRVNALLQAIHPFLNQDEVQVDRMKGGGYNRIIGYSFKNSQGHREEFVIRIPRFDQRQLVHDLTPLLLLRDQSELPVPQVITFDVTTQNALEEPYMIQKRIAGTSALELYPELQHHERLQVARRVGSAIRFMTSVHSPKLGRLTSDLSEPSGRPKIMLEPLQGTSNDISEPYRNEMASKPVADLLTEILHHRNRESLAQTPPDTFESEYWEDFIAMIQEMKDLDYLTDMNVALCHLDFEPRNMLVNRSTSPTDVSAFLDWDSAIFAPSFMVCAPPYWLWAWQTGGDEDEDEDESKASDTPADSENRELKATLEEAAGPIYAKYAYDPAYRLARRLVQRILFGLKSNEDSNDANKFLAEWDELREQKIKK